MGVGLSAQLAAFRWGVGGNIVLVWRITSPAFAILAWLICKIIILFYSPGVRFVFPRQITFCFDTQHQNWDNKGN